jgi:hypothetical protein
MCMTTDATAVLLDADGVEMSESVPARYVDGKIRVDHVLYTSRTAYATWIEFRPSGGREPLRALIRQDDNYYVGAERGFYVRPGDTMTISPMAVTIG